jgi:hypothetical protein
MDFVSVWKVVSLVSTGGFGILGLVTEFKNPVTKKLTRWGSVSLAGILISTAFGVAAQLKETSQQQAKAADDAAKGLKISEQTRDSLADLNRLLTSLDDLTIEVAFKAPCRNSYYAKFCAQVNALPKSESNSDFKSTEFDKRMWEVWPRGKRDDVTVKIFIYRAELAASATLESLTGMTADLEYQVAATNYPIKALPRFNIEVNKSDEVELQIADAKPGDTISTGRIQGAADLAGCVLFIVQGLPTAMSPSRLILRTKQGRIIELDADRFVRSDFSSEMAYSYKFDGNGQ